MDGQTDEAPQAMLSFGRTLFLKANWCLFSPDPAVTFVWSQPHVSISAVRTNSALCTLDCSAPDFQYNMPPRLTETTKNMLAGKLLLTQD